MHVEQKVQFFNSESSFGSQPNMSNSRYYDLTNQIVEEVQNIFHTLRKQILPTKQLTNQEKITYLINRANIISVDTIPQHIAYLEKIDSPKQAKDQLKKCQEKLRKLIKDYNSLSQGTMIHKQFYNIYGKETHRNLFFKKSDPYEEDMNMNMNMQPQVVQIIDNSRTKQLKATPRNLYMNIPKTGRTQKQTNDLNQQIIKLKKRELQIRKQANIQINNQKINCEKRIKLLLELIDASVLSPNEDVKKYKNQLTINQTNLETAYIKISQLQQRNAKVQSELANAQNFKKSLVEQLNGYRKLQNSRLSDFDDLQNRSVHSHQNGQSGKKGSNQYEKTIKRLSAQRDLLRNQLNKQRQISYQRKGSSQQESSKELNRLRKHLSTQNHQLQKITMQFDKMRVEVIQVNIQNKRLKKQLASTKQNNQSLKSRAKRFDQNSLTTNIQLPKSQKQLSLVSSVNKFSVNKYEGEGIQGHPYYELLGKQFKIRFKRACLKSKELLQKTNGIEVGVITEFIPANIVRVLIHLTNYSEVNITYLKIKVINPNDNKIQCEAQEIKVFAPNQQFKIPVTVYLKNYPIGPVVLVLDYMQEGKQDLRLLLPVHIFKCMEITRREQKMMNPSELSIKNQRKIGKDFSTLKQYFNCQGYSDIHVCVHQQHTNTTFYMDLVWSRQDLTLKYEHIQGHNTITQYFIKTVSSLLQKC